jgi:hypothetical protein
MALFANFEFWDDMHGGSQGTFPLYGAQLDGFHFVTTRGDNVTYNDDVPRMLAAYRNGNYLRMRINGAPVGGPVYMPPDPDGRPANLDAEGADIYLGANAYADQCLRGVIAEIVVAADVTVDDALALDEYLFDKYADALRGDAAH